MITMMMSNKNIIKIIEIKILCKKLNIIKVDNSSKGFVFKLRNIQLDYIDNLISLAKDYPNKIKLLPNLKLIYINVFAPVTLCCTALD